MAPEDRIAVREPSIGRDHLAVAPGIIEIILVAESAEQRDGPLLA
jgi:hypothetical protein